MAFEMLFVANDLLYDKSPPAFYLLGAANPSWETEIVPEGNEWLPFWHPFLYQGLLGSGVRLGYWSEQFIALAIPVYLPH